MCVPAASPEEEGMVGSHGIAVQVVPILTVGGQDIEGLFHVGTGCSYGGRFPGDSGRKATCASKGRYKTPPPKAPGLMWRLSCALWQSTCFSTSTLCTCYRLNSLQVSSGTQSSFYRIKTHTWDHLTSPHPPPFSLCQFSPAVL